MSVENCLRMSTDGMFTAGEIKLLLMIPLESVPLKLQSDGSVFDALHVPRQRWPITPLSSLTTDDMVREVYRCTTVAHLFIPAVFVDGRNMADS